MPLSAIPNAAKWLEGNPALMNLRLMKSISSAQNAARWFSRYPAASFHFGPVRLHASLQPSGVGKAVGDCNGIDLPGRIV